VSVTVPTSDVMEAVWELASLARRKSKLIAIAARIVTSPEVSKLAYRAGANCSPIRGSV
jgi:hypothetical protein